MACVSLSASRILSPFVLSLSTAKLERSSWYSLPMLLADGEVPCFVLQYCAPPRVSSVFNQQTMEIVGRCYAWTCIFRLTLVPVFIRLRGAHRFPAECCETSLVCTQIYVSDLQIKSKEALHKNYICCRWQVFESTTGDSFS